ncbi:DUF3284 domain-containing protein [Lacrimispora saccharolytica]|uniref:DUF3284 domain-containing protein n=1 Tax=Lacrimispora saccharolytica (strain ATCC 35040 / DSM 2544 / NRCC 2533 / WM1) TaxID=610130 RepID=D9R3Z9_LACSW|nr:DUF3284 domain-containing protein [Lacrimispora saccharolytica]ADL03112.1 hypothetical protein Closa_0475 [[Clostridium] saccharolyticum WM1]QRV18712.1 DUF3284 domain-containing protein [Lacrimispora saccharolytica]
MEVNQKLNVEAKEFFNALAASVAYDISQATGKKVNPDQIYSGYGYKKKMKSRMGQESNVDVVIKQFVSPSCYEASFRTSHGTNFILYEIEDSKDGNIMVHYREKFEGGSTSYSLNYKIVSWFYQKSSKKRISRMLSSMESFIRTKAESQGDLSEYPCNGCPQEAKEN